MPVIAKYTRSLPCLLTHDELVQAVRDLSAVLEVSQHEEGDQKAKKKAMASRLADLENQRQELGRKITLGRENRDVEVDVEADYKKGIAIEIRTDTYEIVCTRPLTVEERQLELKVASQQPQGDPDRPMACQGDGCGHLLENHEEWGCAIQGCPCQGFHAAVPLSGPGIKTASETILAIHPPIVPPDVETEPERPRETPDPPKPRRRKGGTP